MTTAEIPQIFQIDQEFERQSILATLADNKPPTVANYGVLRTVYDQHERASILFDTMSEDSEPFSLDNTTDVQTLHIVLGGNASNTRQFGTFSESDFVLRLVTIGVHFGNKSFVRPCLRAIENTENCTVESFETETDQILSRYLMLRADENYNYPPNLTAWAVLYKISHFQPTLDEDYES